MGTVNTMIFHFILNNPFCIKIKLKYVNLFLYRCRLGFIFFAQFENKVFLTSSTTLVSVSVKDVSTEYMIILCI